MKLTNRQKLLISFMLFSMFFGAGNLIFPPFLGQNAAASTPAAMAGFLVTAVILPVLGVIVVAQSDGLNRLAGRVGRSSVSSTGCKSCTVYVWLFHSVLYNCCLACSHTQ